MFCAALEDRIGKVGWKLEEVAFGEAQGNTV